MGCITTLSLSIANILIFFFWRLLLLLSIICWFFLFVGERTHNMFRSKHISGLFLILVHRTVNKDVGTKVHGFIPEASNSVLFQNKRGHTGTLKNSTLIYGGCDICSVGLCKWIYHEPHHWACIPGCCHGSAFFEIAWRTASKFPSRTARINLETNCPPLRQLEFGENGLSANNTWK